MRRSPPTGRRRIRAVWGGLIVVLVLMIEAAPSAQANAADAKPGLGELEEPGQIERMPVDEVSAGSGDAENLEAESNPALQEATTVLPDSEAVDTTIGDDGEEGISAVDVEDGIEDEDLHPEEATTIMPDGEAIDESIEETSEAVEDSSAPGTPGAPEPAAQPEWSIRWQNAFIVERVDDPSYQFLFGGRIQNDWGVYGPDSDLEDAFGNEGTGTKFRRARLYFQGQFFRFGFFKAEYDFSDGEDGTAFTDVYAGLNLPEIGLLRVGHFKEPFSLEFQNSSNFISFNERAGLDAFSPGRNSGIMLNGNFLIRDSTYAVAVTRRTDDLGEGFSSKADYHVTARITGLPYFEDSGRRLLHLEVGYSHQFADKDEGTRYRQFPGSDFAPKDLVDTGVLSADSVDLVNAGLALVEGALSFQTEATVTILRGGLSEDPVFWGAYAELSWWITGETRRYLRGRGVFSRVVPRSRFDPEKGQWGAFEAAVRYSWLDLSNDGIRGGTLSEWSLALNWVLFSNLRVSNNYVLSRTGDRAGTDAGMAHSWVTRFQIDF